MRKYREINWSEVVRRSIEEYIERLEEARTRVPASEVLEELVEQGVDASLLAPLGAGEEERMYREMVKREWKRLSTTQAR